MRPLLIVLAVFLAASLPSPAQRGGGGHAGGGGMHSGGGFHGGGGVARGGFHAGAGFRGGGGYRPGFRSGYRFRGTYPLYYGGFGFWPYTYWYPDLWYSDAYGSDYSDSGYAPNYSYQPAASSPVIINQQFQEPAEPNAVLRQYSYTPPPMPEPGPPQTAPAPPTTSASESRYGTPLYLIAFNDGVIRAALAYWAQGSTLHYVTMDHEQKLVPLASVDRSLSARLNHERNVTFQLPR